MKSWLRTNRGLGLCLAAFMGIFYYLVQLDPGFHRRLYDGFSLGFFPTLSIAAVVVFSLVLIFDRQRNEPVPSEPVLSWSVLLSMLVIFGGGLVYVLLLPTVGFPIATPVYLIALMLTLGMPVGIVPIVAMLAVTALVYVLFFVLGFPLPLGILAR